MGLLVVHPGLHATVQDRGRTGYREWGVPVAGAFDRGASDLANALLGNSADAAVLELTLTGGSFQARIPLAIALAGAPMRAAIVRLDGRECPLTIPQCAPLGTGERLVLGPSTVGARTYLAVRGGWRTPLVLGSRSSEERLRAGDVLPAEPGSTPSRRPAEIPPVGPGRVPIRVVDGPDAPPGFDWKAWEEGSFQVGPQSDRMGLRLVGEIPSIAPSPDRISTPVAPGAIQVAGGRAVILGVACGTMGGYPHVAHVITADLDRIGQARPGDVLHFRRIDLAEARRIDRLECQLRPAYFQRVATLAADSLGLCPDWQVPWT